MMLRRVTIGVLRNVRVWMVMLASNQHRTGHDRPQIAHPGASERSISGSCWCRALDADTTLDVRRCRCRCEDVRMQIPLSMYEDVDVDAKMYEDVDVDAKFQLSLQIPPESKSPRNDADTVLDVRRCSCRCRRPKSSRCESSLKFFGTRCSRVG